MPKVLIVGGGWAGLSAATRLVESGWEVVLCERAPELGGRSTSFLDRTTGEYLDHGPHLFAGAYTRSLELLGVWGSAVLIDFDAGSCPIWLGRDGEATALDLGNGTIAAGLSLWRAGIAGWGDISGVKRLWKLVESFDSESSSKLTVGDLLREAGVSQGVTGFIRMLTLAVMNLSPEQAAAAPMVRTIKEGLLVGGSAARLGIALKPLREIIAVPAQRFLVGRRVEVRTSCAVRSIKQVGAKMLIDFDAGSVSAEAVVLSVPPDQAAALLDGTISQKIFAGLRSFEYSPIVGMHMEFDRPVLPYRMAYLASGAGEWIFARGDQQQGRWAKMSAVVSAPPSRQDLSDEELLKRLQLNLREALPSVSGANVSQAKVIRTVKATVALTPANLKLRSSSGKIADRIYVAGDWCETGLPATIESAARSGWDAAGELLSGN